MGLPRELTSGALHGCAYPLSMTECRQVTPRLWPAALSQPHLTSWIRKAVAGAVHLPAEFLGTLSSKFLLWGVSRDLGTEPTLSSRTGGSAWRNCSKHTEAKIPPQRDALEPTDIPEPTAHPRESQPRPTAWGGCRNTGSFCDGWTATYKAFPLPEPHF